MPRPFNIPQSFVDQLNEVKETLRARNIDPIALVRQLHAEGAISDDEIQSALELMESAPYLNALIQSIDEDIVPINAEVQGKAQAVLSKTDLSKELAESLAYYREQYERLDSQSKLRFSWEEVEICLLAHDGHFLHLAEGMNNKGIMFGVNETGHLLFADEGNEPIMTNMTYSEARNRVLYENEEGKIAIKRGKPVKTGYELFPHRKGYEKSYEIELFEKNTGNPIVESCGRKEWQSIWLECGENRESMGYSCCPLAVFFSPYSSLTIVRHVIGGDEAYDPSRGVRRLLRVPKQA